MLKISTREKGSVVSEKRYPVAAFLSLPEGSFNVMAWLFSFNWLGVCPVLFLMSARVRNLAGRRLAASASQQHEEHRGAVACGQRPATP